MQIKIQVAFVFPQIFFFTGGFVSSGLIWYSTLQKYQDQGPEKRGQDKSQPI